MNLDVDVGWVEERNLTAKNLVVWEKFYCVLPPGSRLGRWWDYPGGTAISTQSPR